MEGKYSLDKTCWGWQIKTPNPKGKFFLYLSKVHRNGTYSFSTDYTYAKNMTLKTAKKHLAILNKEVN